MVDLGELCSGWIPASRVVGGESGGAREVEQLMAHQLVPEVGVGVARSGLSAAARARRRRVVAVGGGPVR